MNLPLRIALPTGHLLVVDGVILVLWLWHASTLYLPRVDLFRPPIEVVFVQEGGSVIFEPRFISLPDELLFLGSGNLPAMLVSDTVRPEVHIIKLSKRWGPVWFSIHEVVSLLFWFAIGVLFDVRVLRIGKLLVTYLAVRVGFTAFLFLHGAAAIGWRFEVLSWMAFGAYVVVLALRRLYSKTLLRQ
jgi:hypothetical protein